jgi:hypothetical protein
MARALGLPFVAMLLHSAQPAAAICLQPDKAAERMDEYFGNPRSPGAYRALAGLGDPRIASFPDLYPGQVAPLPTLPDWEERKALIARMLPEQRPDPLYWLSDEGHCRLDHPARLARARIAALGADHPYVRQWFAVQKAVFEACINGTPEGARPLPDPIRIADPALAALQSDDRGYQQASRLFYEKSPRAHEAFRRIAQSSSRHAPMARYMMIVIKAEWERPGPTLGGARPPSSEKRPPDLMGAVAEAKAVLADPRFVSVHPLAQALIGSIAWKSANDIGERRFEPNALKLRTAQLRLVVQALKLPARRLASDHPAAERYARAAADVEYFQRDMFKKAWLPSAVLPRDAYTSRALAAAARREPLAAWLILPPSPFERFTAWASSPRRPHPGLRRYIARQRRDSAWLTVRVAQAEHYDPGLWRFIDRRLAKARTCPSDRDLALLPTLLHHQVRAALMYGGRGRAQTRAFRRAMGFIERWPWRQGVHFHQTTGDAFNYLIAMGRLSEARRLASSPAFPKDGGSGLPKLILARDEDELVREMARIGRSEILGTRYDNMAGMPFFERLSVEVLGRLAARSEVPADYRTLFARVAWTRLYATGQPIPRSLDLLMRRLNPEVTRHWVSTPGAGRADPRLLLDVLRSPGLNILMVRLDPDRPYPNSPGLTRIDIESHSDNNWWCEWQIERHRKAAAAALHRELLAGWNGLEDDRLVERAPRRLRAVLAQSWLWRSRASTGEQERLAAIDCAPKQLAEGAVRWVASSYGAQGQDEALALAVRATRYGCQRQGGHGLYSRAAFTLLHRRFPHSPAAKRTPYWFDCSHFFVGCASAAAREAS